MLHPPHHQRYPGSGPEHQGGYCRRNGRPEVSSSVQAKHCRSESHYPLPYCTLTPKTNIHLPNPQQSIDLIVNSSTSASLLRKKLLQHPMSPLVESSGLLYYQVSSPARSPGGTTQTPGIEVRLTPEMLCPYLPSAARPATTINPVPAHLPYVSLVDLIAFKMDACGLRDSVPKKQQEARDAAALLEVAAEHSALQLDEEQARVVEECLPDVLRHSEDPDKQGKSWWQIRLSGKCDPDARKSPDMILTDLIEGMSLDESSKRSSTMTTTSSAEGGDGNWWPKGLVGRTSSSSSKNSMSSSSSSIASQVSSAGSALTSPCATPTSAHGPGFPTHSRTSSKDLDAMPPPRRPRKFSTSQQSPVKASHLRKKSADLRPRRHSQILGSLSSGNIAQNTAPTDDGSMGSPGLTLTARFESTPGEEKLIQGSYF